MRLVWPQNFVQDGALFVEVGHPARRILIATEFDAPDPIFAVDDGDVSSFE